MKRWAELGAGAEVVGRTEGVLLVRSVTEVGVVVAAVERGMELDGNILAEVKGGTEMGRMETMSEV